MTRLSPLALLLASTLSAAPALAQDDLRQSVAADLPTLMPVYRDLHEHPELSFQETRSAALLAKQARALGFDVTEKVGRTGVVAVMRNGAGPTLLVRADMDGLPVKEDTGLPFASTVTATTPTGLTSPVMHACGHDTHMTTWLGTAMQMAGRKAEWSGTLVMVLQPAEETGAGAAAMLADGLYTRFPKPDVALAFHDTAAAPAGTIAYTPGYALANVDSVDITVHGVGGHGAYPQTTRDPILLASRIVGSLQQLVSREVDPQDAAVVTVGSFHAGTKHNIISDEAKLQLTVRSYSDETRKLLLDGIRRIARGEGIAAGLPDDKLPEVSVREDEFTPATFNDPALTQKMAGVFRQRFGEVRVIEAPAVMGGEDFSRFAREDKSIKSLIFWVGGVPQAQWDKAQAGGAALPSLHSPFWAPDAEAVVATATEAMTAAALEVLKKGA